MFKQLFDPLIAWYQDTLKAGGYCAHRAADGDRKFGPAAAE